VHLINKSVHLLLKNQFSFQLNWCIMHMWTGSACQIRLNFALTHFIQSNS
jgi:hypothetical protein